MTAQDFFTGLTIESARTIVEDYRAWEAKFADAAPCDPAPSEFLEDVHIMAIDFLHVDSLTPDKLVSFNTDTARAISEANLEVNNAYDDYGVGCKYEDFEGFERFMDARVELGTLIVNAACAIVAAAQSCGELAAA